MGIRGHEVAWGQFVLPWKAKIGATKPSFAAMKVNESSNSVAVSGVDYQLTFDKVRARISGWSYQARR